MFFKIEIGQSIHSYTVQNISKFNGLLSNNVNDVAVIGDTVYVAGSKGLTTFSKSRWRNTGNKPPHVFINEMLVNGKSYATEKKQIDLPSDSNTVEFHFSAIDFKSLGNILFKYRLKGISNNWQLSQNNVASFALLAPGNYTLEVFAMNAHNIWSLQAAYKSFTIAPPWWQTSWFYLIVALASALLIYTLVNWYLHKKHRKQINETSLKRQMAELELRAIKAQINPHFVFNTLNAIQYFVTNNYNEKADEYLNRLASLLRRTLDYSNKTTITIEAEMSYLENYLELEKLRFDKNFSYQILNNLSETDCDIELPPMVLQPHIENALRHGLKNKEEGLKQLDIIFTFANKYLICEIQDNGIGRKAASENSQQNDKEHKSSGIELSHAKLLMYEQVTGKKIKTEIIDNYGEDKITGTGTLIRISISQ